MHTREYIYVCVSTPDMSMYRAWCFSCTPDTRNYFSDSTMYPGWYMLLELWSSLWQFSLQLVTQFGKTPDTLKNFKNSSKACHGGEVISWQ